VADVFNKKEIRGYLMAVKGGGMIQLFAIALGLPELTRFTVVTYLCWLMIAIGVVLAFAGLYMAANHEKPAV
jgi:hypothetical protein